jgi:NAD(P)-dependent dehydrogenase (short-subunit alcohol dehydrogenase family)
MTARTIVVTGTNAGIGRAIVEQFAAAGWNVAATVRDPAAHAGLFAAYPNVRLFPLDVTDEAQAEALAAAVQAAYGGADVLVNNAGALLMGPLETSSMAQIRAQFETNLLGLIMVTRAFLPQLRARRAGTIVNVVSATARLSLPFMSVYSASKSAVAALSEALAAELAPFNIRVKAIYPGGHATQIFARMADGLTPDGVETPASAAYRPFLQRFLALQTAVPPVAAPRGVARRVFRAVQADSGRVEYLVGLDARLMSLTRRLLPPRLIKALIGAMLKAAKAAQPDSRAVLTAKSTKAAKAAQPDS